MCITIAQYHVTCFPNPKCVSTPSVFSQWNKNIDTVCERTPRFIMIISQPRVGKHYSSCYQIADCCPRIKLYYNSRKYANFAYPWVSLQRFRPNPQNKFCATSVWTLACKLMCCDVFACSHDSIIVTFRGHTTIRRTHGTRRRAHVAHEWRGCLFAHCNSLIKRDLASLNFQKHSGCDICSG